MGEQGREQKEGSRLRAGFTLHPSLFSIHSNPEVSQ
jgi:hypothetical protein